MKKKLFTIGCAAVVISLFSSCGSGEGDAADAIGGPAGTAAFAGTTFSFNPTLKFLDGGVLEYVNEDAPSDFPAAPALTPSIGTYTYAPNTGFMSGTLTINLPDLEGGYIRVIELSDFITVGGIVQKCTGTFPTEGAHEMTVVAGTLRAAGIPEKFTTSPDGEFQLKASGALASNTQFQRSFVSSFIGIWGSYGTPLIPRNIGDKVTFTINGEGRMLFQGNIPFYYWELGYVPVIYELSFLAGDNGAAVYQGAVVDGLGTIRVTVDTAGKKDVVVFWSEGDGNILPYEETQYFQ